MANIFGIDVSKWQGNFNFRVAQNEGVKFAILKAGGGDNTLYKDKNFEENYLKCCVNVIPKGAYFYGCALDLEQARTEALYFCSLLKDKKFEYPVFYDVEGSMLRVSRNTLTTIIKEFIHVMESYGYLCGIYMSRSAFDCKVNDRELAIYPHWVASWGKYEPMLMSGVKPKMWQFGGETNLLRNVHIAGVLCDQDYSFIDYPDFLIDSGLNGYTKQAKSDTTIAHEIIDGKWGNGEERKHLLSLCGYEYKSIQDTVNAILRQGY